MRPQNPVGFPLTPDPLHRTISVCRRLMVNENKAMYNLSIQYMAREAQKLNTPEDYANLAEQMKGITGEDFPTDPNVGLTSMAVMNEVLPHTFDLAQELMLERAKERTARAKASGGAASKPKNGTYQTRDGKVRTAQQLPNGTIRIQNEDKSWEDAPSGPTAGVFQLPGQGEAAFGGEAYMRTSFIKYAQSDERRSATVAAEAMGDEARKIMTIMDNPNVLSGTGVSTLVEAAGLLKNIFALAGREDLAGAIDFSDEEQIKASMAKFVMPFVKEQGRSFSDQDLKMFLKASANITSSKEANKLLARFTLVDSMEKIERFDFDLEASYASIGENPKEYYRNAGKNYRAYKKDFPRTRTHADGTFEVIQDQSHISRYYLPGRPKNLVLETTSGALKTHTIDDMKVTAEANNMSLREWFNTLDKDGRIKEVTY